MAKAVPDGVTQVLTHPLQLFRYAEPARRLASRFAAYYEGEAVVNLPRTSNNAGHESLRLARRVKSFQSVLS
ncbi:Aldehyde dehydrogenase (EC, partial [Olavius algarvensis associated proteobacterium Delta 3]